ncbi:MAG: cold-shock protein [Candidatus Hydrogenedentota bacterium]
MSQETQVQARGTVKWFNDQKGYGFIAHDDTQDVFVHYSAIQMDGFRTLQQGEEVVFELYESPKGPQARNVQRLNSPAAQTGGAELTAE